MTQGFHQVTSFEFSCVVLNSAGCCYCIERQQLVADIERLTSDKADLLTRLQDLKAANECENCLM